MPGELAKVAGLTLEKEMRRSMLECIDQFSNILSAFAAIQSHNLLSASKQQLQESISSMTKIFHEISEEIVTVEIVCLQSCKACN